ncbi:hypothetical protein F5Y18DRAFT_371636 [Xylariaceae sp. FL1019]|nr:hypothetical protein F5Y18DRAFT_371636 [Xylariaceae sp. FL1019]
MNHSIPGYYYDPEKRRYFKVEKSKTAPTTAAWSADNVKRRKLDDAEAAAALRRLDLTRNRIKRARVLNEPLTGGFFAREHGEVWDDLQPACFATGLKEKGSVPLGDPGFRGQVKHMYVDGQDDRTGMCTIWATVDERTLSTTYVPRDKDNRLDRRLLKNYHLPNLSHGVVFTEFIMPDLSDIKYNAHSNQILFTCRNPGPPDANILWACAPEVSTTMDERVPHFSLPTNFFESLPIRSVASIVRRTCQGNCVSPALANSPLVCAVGTNFGVVQWARGSDHLSWLTPEPQPKDNGHNLTFPTKFRDIFAVDFHPTNNSVLRIGGRRGVLVSADTRTPWSSWSTLQLPSAITHIRNLNNENQILVAGMRNSLGVYDLRFVRERSREDEESRLEMDPRPAPRSRSHAGKNRSHAPKFNYPTDNDRRRQMERKHDEEACRPVVLFEDYRNNAHTDIGFDYDASTGLVAAAQDNKLGTVALYSVRTGAKVRTLDFTGPGSTPMQPRSISIIRSLQFQTFPRDHMPTLFVGVGPDGGVTAYSFGVDDLGGEE